MNPVKDELRDTVRSLVAHGMLGQITDLKFYDAFYADVMGDNEFHNLHRALYGALMWSFVTVTRSPRR